MCSQEQFTPHCKPSPPGSAANVWMPAPLCELVEKVLSLATWASCEQLRHFIVVHMVLLLEADVCVPEARPLFSIKMSPACFDAPHFWCPQVGGLLFFPLG